MTRLTHEVNTKTNAHRRIALAAALLTLAAFGTPPAAAPEPVRLQLKWTHSFQFAGYYAAQALGYYQDAGLDVTLIEGRPGLDVVETVLNGSANFGVGNSGLLLERSKGKPVVVLATIFQHSALVLIARADHPLQSIHDLAEKTVMIEPHSEELLAYFRQEGLSQEQPSLVEHDFNGQALIDGDVDAMSAYASHEPFFLDQAGFRYQLYSPRSVGIDFYGDLLFTSSRLLKQEPKRVQAFIEASLRGWQYALEHPQETIALIRDRYDGSLDPDFLRFQFEQMTRLIRLDLIEIGYMNPGRWRHIADVYADLGMMDRDFSLDGFLYSARTERDLTWLYWTLFIAIALAALLVALNLFFARANRRYRESLEIATQARAAEAESEARLRTLMRTASAGICMVHGRRLIFANDAMTRLTGYSEEELLEMEQLEFVSPKYREMVGCRAESRQRGGKEPERYEIEILTKSEELRWIDLTAARTTYQRKTVSIATLHDISSLKVVEEQLRRANEELKTLASIDALTGLPNRRFFYEIAERALASAQRNRGLAAIMSLDLDRLKSINDSFGHQVGDQVLVETARRLNQALRHSDTAARLGGDEFLILLPQIKHDQDLLLIAHKIRALFVEPFVNEGLAFGLSISIGSSIYPRHGTDIDALIKASDQALYVSKRLRNGAFTIFDDLNRATT